MAIIRKATTNDSEKILSLLKQFPTDPEIPNIDWEDARKSLPQLISADGGMILVSEHEGALAGLVTLSFPLVLRFGGTYALIEDFIVDESFRGKGVGSPLLQAAVKEARDKGCRELQVNGASDIGKPVYIKNGMREAGSHLKITLN